MNKSAITSKDVKLINKNRIYRYIYKAGQTSRQEIFEQIRLSMPTIHQNLKSLIEDELIVIDGNFDSTGGRKAQIFSVNSNARFAVSLNINANGIYARLIDMYGNILAEAYLEDTFVPEEGYYRQCAGLIEKCIDTAGVGREKILGVGITIPGILDDTNKIIVNAPTMGVRNCSIEDIAGFIPYPWIAMNDAKSGCYALYWFNMRGTGRKRYIYLMLSQGVGGAIFDENFDVSGNHNRSGEFGHMTIHPGGRKCFCGREGCFESYVSSRCLSSDCGVTLKEFFEQLKNGDKDKIMIFEEYLDNLAIGINNLYTICDCDIVIGGQVAEYLKDYKDILETKLAGRYSFDTDGDYISFSGCSDMKASAGAALTFISGFIESI